MRIYFDANSVERDVQKTAEMLSRMEEAKAMFYELDAGQYQGDFGVVMNEKLEEIRENLERTVELTSFVHEVLTKYYQYVQDMQVLYAPPPISHIRNPLDGADSCD